MGNAFLSSLGGISKSEHQALRLGHARRVEGVPSVFEIYRKKVVYTTF